MGFTTKLFDNKEKEKKIVREIKFLV